MSLFAEDGVVHSPLYGARPARDFYPTLFEDTSQANLTLKSVMSGTDQTGRTTVSFWFHFDWRLPSGAAAPFDVVDVATLGSDGKIMELHVIYDTVDVRPAFEARVALAAAPVTCGHRSPGVIRTRHHWPRSVQGVVRGLTGRPRADVGGSRQRAMLP